MLKIVFHFSVERFISKSQEISLTRNVIYSGCCQCFLYLYAKCFISPTSAIELNTKNKLAAPPQFRFCFCCYHKKVFHFSAGRFTSKSREISLTMNVIYSGCCECFLYLYAKCFISPTSAIELNTKNKSAAPPQFRFCFCCYHHPIFWKFVTLILMGIKSIFFFDCTGRSGKEGGKERKKRRSWILS